MSGEEPPVIMESGYTPREGQASHSHGNIFQIPNWALISQLFSEACDGTSIFSYFYQTNVFN